MRSQGFLFILLANLITNYSLYAQSLSPEIAPPKQGQDVVIDGRQKHADIGKVLSAITNKKDGQLARFELPICPAAIGMQVDQGLVVENRIREIASSARLRIAPLKCQPNLVVVYTEHGSGFLAYLHHKHPELFVTLPLSQVDSLLSQSGPSWAWQMISPKRRDGGPVEMIDQIQFGSTPQPVARGAYRTSNAEMSRLPLPFRQDIDVALVVIDLSSASKLSLQQVSDYAAMLGLSSLRLDHLYALSKPTILSLFDDFAHKREPQSGITTFDIAYLRALYSGESGVSAAQRISSMAKQINDYVRSP